MRFAITIFISAFLLFQVQPLIGNILLPWFGGGPTVWTACLLFFQTLLLCGYLYAYLLDVGLSVRSQMVSHLTLLAASLLLLPIAPTASQKPVSGEEPLGQILWLLLATVGGPYFLLASTGPLLQRWYSRTSAGRSPYRLYALSNAGSLLALLSYPFLFEPWLTRDHQSLAWTWMYAGYVVLTAWCAVRLLHEHTGEPIRVRCGAVRATPKTTDDVPDRPATWLMLFWFALAAAGSVMLLATTNRLCLDTATIPLLWVLPLSLYLLSFIICFDKPVWYERRVFGLLLLLGIPASCRVVRLGGFTPLAEQVVVYSALLFTCCMTCHGELVRTRPSPQHLTLFYLIVAAGGAMGGVLVAIAAPALLNDFVEYQIGLVVCGVLYVTGLSVGHVWSQVRAASFWIAVTAGVVQSICCLFSFSLSKSPAFSETDATSAIAVFLIIQFIGLALTAAWERRLRRVLWLWGGVSITLAVWLAGFAYFRSSPQVSHSTLLAIASSTLLPTAVFGWFLVMTAHTKRAHLQDWVVWMILAGAGCAIGGLWYLGNVASWQMIVMVIVLLGFTSGAWLSRKLSNLSLWLPSAPLLVLAVVEMAEGDIDRRVNYVYQSRNFYGALAVRYADRTRTKGETRTLDHGDIVHGLQFLDEDTRRRPTTYYGFQSGIGQAIRIGRELAERDGADRLRVGVVGLGVGTLAAFGRKGDYFRFYEINPDVLRLAQNVFTYLKDSEAMIDVVLGDARILMERELAAGDRQDFDILAIDAFSSDAIPIHLLTCESGDIYRQHLKPGGVLAIHISNRHLDLSSVTRGLAEDLGCQAFQIDSPDDEAMGLASARWVLVTSNERVAANLAVLAARRPGNPSEPKLRWTDDYHSLWHIVSFR
jgi:hypothetical protein